MPEMALYMTIPPVWVEPVVHLKRWGFMRDRFGCRLVGFNVTAEYNERLSSAVVEVDPVELTAKTQSGRVYLLHGPEDRATAEKLIEDHLARWGLADDDAVFVAFADAVSAIRGPHS